MVTKSTVHSFSIIPRKQCNLLANDSMRRLTDRTRAKIAISHDRIHHDVRAIKQHENSSDGNIERASRVHGCNGCFGRAAAASSFCTNNTIARQYFSLLYLQEPSLQSAHSCKNLEQILIKSYHGRRATRDWLEWVSRAPVTGYPSSQVDVFLCFSLPPRVLSSILPSQYIV